LAGVTPAAVTQGCRFRLAAACVGDLIELEHPAIKSWLADQKAKGRKRKMRDETSRRELRAKANAKKRIGKPATGGTITPKPAPRSEGAAPEREAAPKLDEFGFAEEILELSVREVAERFGTDRQYLNWLEAYVKQQRGCGDWLKNQQTRGSLIERELVHRQVFAHISALQHRILTDATRTIVARVYPMAKSGDSPEQAEREVRALLSKQLKSLRSTVLRALKPKPAKPDIPE
jgi:hypothetical protein